MMKLGWMIAFLLLSTSITFGQGEGVEAMTGNPQLMQHAPKLAKANPGTFDSTFIYTSDVIQLPVFDEFSKSRFQTYNADYGDPGVTFDKVYRLLEEGTNLPYDNSTFFTAQPRYRYTVDVGNNQITQELLPSLTVQFASLANYPPVFESIVVFEPFTIYDTIDYPNPVDTVWMSNPEIFQDSATQFFASVNDPSKIWLDAHVYHNYGNAKNPWSLGVATFDGLDENGFAYALGSTITNYADYLTSKPIDMSSLDAGDSVYFSFLFQKEGYCDLPEANDSLILEFYADDLDQWKHIWSTPGGGVDNFEHVHIRISSADYFKDGFQFRFKNYGSLAGSLDHFHLDYVNLRAISGIQDSIIRDFAFVYPIHTLLNDYTSVPWDHYKNNPTGKMSSDVKVMVRNSDNVPENEQDGSIEIVYGTSTEASFVLSENLLNNGDLNYLPWTTYTSYHDLSGGGRFDETKTGLWEEFHVVSGATHQNSNFTQNDSTVTNQKFINYYSYDDGTAEKAYGPTGVQSLLAIKYAPYEADSLIGAMIHFVPTVNDVQNNLFLLTVWNDAGGQPGTIIYQDNLFAPRQPQYQYDENVFATYYFEDTLKVPVSGTFYIGWQQYDQERLGVGLDMNIVNNDKTYYSVNQGVTWEQSAFEGSVMIRPIFSTAFDAVLGLKEQVKESAEITIYPNPSNGEVTVRVVGEEYKGTEVFTLHGTKVGEFTTERIDLSSQPAGVYFLRVNGAPQMHKLIKL